MNRKAPQPLSYGTEGKNPSINVRDSRNPSISAVKTTNAIKRPSPSPAPPAPPVAKKQK